MSRDVFGLRLSSHSPAGYHGFSIEPPQRWLRYGLLLLVLLPGLWVAGALRQASTELAILVSSDLASLRSIAALLVISLMAVACLGCFRRLRDKAQARDEAHVKHHVSPVVRDSSASFWRAQEDERKQLSRELHDSVGQLLTGVGLHLRALRSATPSSSEMRTQLDEACRLNAEALRQVRDLAMGLRPALLDDVSLITALEWQVRQFSRQTGISTSLEADREIGELSEAKRTCIYRCVLEALTNCAKHSQATNIRIVISGSRDAVRVTIEDDGIGFDTKQRAAGIGLLGMRERVADVRGILSVDSREVGGTALTLEIPVFGSVLA
ncbi:MAG TPA: sensor histidine kinase [Terriglobales bacterium]|nr:sensor histidine kinase [Terriglobales bacterium]